MPRLDLNCDLGEGVGDDAALFPLITSANIACGFHAADPASMRRACELAVEHGVTIGAHPSYRDRDGFGRREVEIAAPTLRAEVLEQIDALRAAASEVGAVVSYVKPHGALYNRIVTDPVQARAVAGAAAEAGLPLLGLAGSALQHAADEFGMRFAREAFADRGYLADGSLAPRGTPGALLTDPGAIADRVLQMVTTGTIVSLDGARVEVDLDSICVHGDTPSAVAIASAVRNRVVGAQIEVGAWV